MKTQRTANDGTAFLIRTPDEGDAEKIIAYSKLVFSSTDQVLTTPGEYTITVDQEKIWINNALQNPAALTLVAEMSGEIAGLLFFVPMGKVKSRHTGEFGVNVHPHHQGKGIGKELIRELLTWAKKHSQIEKVFLNVFATNINAINLYKNLGFVEEGRQIKAIKQPNGEYVDTIQMYIETIG